MLFLRAARRLVLGILAIAPLLALARPVTFDVPAQPCAEALLAFSQQTSTEVLFSFDELQRVTSTALRGTFEPEEALRQLLSQTEFSAHRDARGKFVVKRQVRNRAAITGRVVDTRGQPVAGARVSLSGAREHPLTDAHGAFVFPSLAAGTYRLRITSRGYRSITLERLALAADATHALPTQTLEREDELVQLDPYLVAGRDGRSDPLNRSAESPRIAAGNLDLPRTENDALPYRIYDRAQLNRSGVVTLNEFLQREVLDSDTASRPPDQNGGAASYLSSSSNLNLRGFADSTLILVNGRRLPEVLTSYSGVQQADVNLIPLGLVQQVEVLSVAASALYSGNPVGGVINIVLRQDLNATEVTTTHSNALGGFDAPQNSVALQHGQTLLDGKLRLRLSATVTHITPPVETELHYRRDRAEIPVALTDPLYRATPNIRSPNQTPLFGPGSATVTSVAPGANGTGGLAAFAGRQGVRNFDLFDAPGGFAASPNSVDYPYGRRQQRSAFFGSVTYDLFPWLQLGVDAFHAETSVRRGYDVLTGDLTLAATSPFNPFGQTVRVSLNEIVPALGANYSESRLRSSSAVLGLLVKLPREWRVNFDAQYARNITKYRGIAGVDSARWQQLVDDGLYHPLRDTQVFAPPAAFLDRAVVFRSIPGKFVTLGDYDTLDAAVRVTHQAITLPTGVGALNVGADYRRNHLAPYVEEFRFADGTLSQSPTRWVGRTLERFSFFGELDAPLLSKKRLPRWLERLDATLATRYVAADTSNETNLAPALGLKADLPGGFSLRGSVTLSSRFPTPSLSKQAVGGGGPGGGLDLKTITDPRRGETYDVPADEPDNPGLATEDAVTQTFGVIFQRGKIHRLRAALDFADTQKDHELVDLTPQGLVNLEALFPERITRNPAQPGDPGNTGRITALLIGNVNAATRHSQTWSTALDYAWTECLGGTLELRGRWFYFSKYDLQLFSNSPVVDELKHPDGAAPGILRHRVNLGASWSTKRYSFGVDGRYYHSRLLPVVERAAQGDRQIKPFCQIDAFVQSDLTRWLPWKPSHFGLRGQVRVDNVFATDYPRYINDPSGAGVQPYGDFRGRTYSLSVTATF